jgi:hypothetical protein
MNCKDDATALRVTRRLPKQFEPDAARKLLVTAAARKHTVVVHQLLQLQSMQPHIDPPTLEAMLRPLTAFSIQHSPTQQVACRTCAHARGLLTLS